MELFFGFLLIYEALPNVKIRFQSRLCRIGWSWLKALQGPRFRCWCCCFQATSQIYY